METEMKNSILIVDDERSNITFLRSLLNQDYRVYASTGGEDALETAEEFLPDLILLDIVMPEMDGFDVLQALKTSEKTKAIPVIFATGMDCADAEQRALDMGIADYIAKPFRPAIVKLRVNLHMALVNSRKN